MWGVALTLVIGVLLIAGGLAAINTAMIIGALPLSLVLALMGVSLVEAIVRDTIKGSVRLTIDGKLVGTGLHSSGHCGDLISHRLSGLPLKPRDIGPLPSVGQPTGVFLGSGPHRPDRCAWQATPFFSLLNIISRTRCRRLKRRRPG